MIPDIGTRVGYANSSTQPRLTVVSVILEAVAAMAGDVQGYASWADVVWTYLHGPARPLPVHEFMAAFDATFAVRAVSWNWREPAVEARPAQFGAIIDRRIDDWRPPPARLFDVHVKHPLICWFAKTLDSRPMSLGRVPADAVLGAKFDLIRETMEPVGAAEQLWLPYRLTPVSYRAFVLVRPEDDFSDGELELASRVQPLLDLAGRLDNALPQEPANDPFSLTARELAVLRMLSGGGTAERIARRLGITPRTVNTHLTHIYRKMGVDGRMRAVMEAQRAGLLPVSSSPTPAAQWERPL